MTAAATAATSSPLHRAGSARILAIADLDTPVRIAVEIVKRGDRLKLEVPFGDFTLRESGKPLLLVAELVLIFLDLLLERLGALIVDVLRHDVALLAQFLVFGPQLGLGRHHLGLVEADQPGSPTARRATNGAPPSEATQPKATARWGIPPLSIE